MWRVPVACIIGLLLFPHHAAGQARPSFSGTWNMDTSRSESAHQDVPIGPYSLIIQQTSAEISIETRRADSASSPVNSEKLVYPLNGAERTNSTETGQSIKVKAHWDGPKLIAETERDINGATVTTSHVFRLGANGNEITIDKTLTVQHGYQSPGTPKTTGSGKDVFIRAPKP